MTGGSTSRTFRTWGNKEIDRAVSKLVYDVRTQDKQKLKKNPEFHTAASFMRTEWDRRIAAIYDGKPYRDPYGRPGSGKVEAKRKKKGTSI
jgi:hypothetical protein